jgi:fused signal recognition particle receptor
MPPATKNQMKFFETLVQTFAGKPIDWNELEAAMIRADLGVPVTMRIIDKLQEREAWSATGIGDVVKIARKEISEILSNSSAPRLEPLPGKPHVIVVAGVNGTGKTTSTAKLAHYLKQKGHSVILAAADTFRAAAIEQLSIWAERLDIDIIRGQYNADPAALCYEAFQSAVKRKADFLICDTAGRLHTRSNLMAELQKVQRSLSKHDPKAPHDVFLVVDATTGGNALVQAKEFHQALGLTGLIVTKLDGSGKGGIVVAIQEQFGIPTRFVGTGEQISDFARFDNETFIENLL